MKKFRFIFIMLLVIVFAPIANAIEWHTTNQASVAWDSVAVASGTVEYKVYVANAITDPGKTNPSEIGTTPDLTYTLTLNTEGRYLIGVKTVRSVDGAVVSESVIGWSDDSLIVKDGAIFGVQYFEAPPVITGLRAQ